MPRNLYWLPTVIRVAIAPVLVGALAMLLGSARTPSDVGSAIGLILLSAMHALYWWKPWPSQPMRALGAFLGMVLINFVLLNLLGLNQPLLWLYPALIAGAGLRPLIAAVGIGLTALAAAAPLAVEGSLVHPLEPLAPAAALGASHSVLLSIVLAGLGMTAVRQLIVVNAELSATRAELADAAVSRERERLARELHDLLGRTLSLIAVKSELAGRLSAKSDQSAEAELADVQRLARQAVRDVRQAVTGTFAPSLETELAAAEAALRVAGIDLTVTKSAGAVDPAHASTIAWAIREGITNVVRHSRARRCRIVVRVDDDATYLEIADDGRGPVSARPGTGLDGLAERVHALGGTLDVGPDDGRGFRLRVRLDAAVLPRPQLEITR